MLEIRDQDALLQYALDVFVGKTSPTHISISDDLDVQKQLKGTEWDGSVDHRLANYVLNLQQDIFEIYNITFDDRLNFRSPEEIINQIKVKVTISDGSTELFEHISGAIQSIMNKVNGKQATIITVIAIMAALSYLSFDSYNEREIKREQIKASVREKIEDEETKRKILELADKAMNNSYNSFSSSKHLSKLMQKNDTLFFPKTGKKLTKQEAVAASQQKEVDVVSQNYCVDGTYLIATLSLKNWSIRLEQRGIGFNASTEGLTSKSIQQLHDLFKRAHESGQTPKIKLQVVAEIEGNKVKSAHITGIGEPRPDAKSLTEILSLPIEKRIETSKLPLFDDTSGPEPKKPSSSDEES